MAAGAPTVEFFDDPRPFLAQAREHLAADPVINTVVATIAERLALRLDERGDLPDLGYAPWWAIVRDEAGEVVGAAMRTAPQPLSPLFVLPMPEEGAVELARTMLARAEVPGGVNGALPAAQVVADTVASRTAGSATVLVHTRLFELGDLVEPAQPPGRLRLARPDEAELLLGWHNAFGVEAAEQAGRASDPGLSDHVGMDDVLDRIAECRSWVWVDGEDRPVHLTGANPPSFGVRRIGPVYTPRQERGRGYASAAVAEVSRQIVEGGHRACLFTDQANPTSNEVYLRIGYRAVVDMANLVIR